MGHCKNLKSLCFCFYTQTEKKHKTMDKTLDFICALILFSHNILIAAYTLTPPQSVSDGQTLISQGGKFELGFFSPSNTTKNRYVGIWYKTIPVMTVVWVANRESPIPDTSGVLKINKTGNIVIVDKKESIIWSSNISKSVENPIIEFLESGNLVLRDARNGDPDSYLWHSFDYPGDTLMHGMKFGWNLRTGMNRYLSPWSKSDNPSRGDFTLGLEVSGFPELIMRKGSKTYYRGGLWGGIQNIDTSDLEPNSMFTYQVIQNAEEIFLTYQLVDQSKPLSVRVVQDGSEGRFEIATWIETTNSWSRLVSAPRDRCDGYALCGMYSSCEVMMVSVCQCLPGFKPNSPKDWSASDWSMGCERVEPLNCSNGDGFRKYANVILPEQTSSLVNVSMTLGECRLRCLRNCSCMAYANLYKTGSGSECILWFAALIDIKRFSTRGQDLYVRMPFSELGKDSQAIPDPEAKSTRKKSVITIASVTSVAGIFVLGFAAWCVWIKMVSKGVIDGDDLQLPLYRLNTITVATNNFSTLNKLGEGGFGPVYKGKLEEGQEIAVKWLSKDSSQGVDAFRNEVILISKLQHRNLVKLLGCCTENEEKMLVYEYMPNNSLGSYIFDEAKRKLLDWQQRSQIIQGIAEGLLYLHRYSRLRIIHRDLKASNVLLDSKMAPKISDFGMARIFGGDQLEANTKRVVGTYGYMSPEYLIEGHFSAKSDVFSFGVLILEIISGKRNWGFRHPDHELNLLGHAWTLFSGDMSLAFVDKSMSITSFDQNVGRYILIGLLCVQKEKERRPTMASVVTMLSSESTLPKPQQPGFYTGRSTPVILNSSYSNNIDFSTTMIEGR